MSQPSNPFEYEAANNLDPDQINRWFIEDHNFSRFLCSRRNIFLVGERGSGKTMTLLYNSWRVAHRRATSTAAAPHELIGVYVPCNTPLTHRTEYELLNPQQAAVLSEHFLVLGVADALLTTLEDIAAAYSVSDSDSLRDDLEFILTTDLPKHLPLFSAMRLVLRRELVETQKRLDRLALDFPLPDALSFASLILPLLETAKRLPLLARSHFSFMIDDAQSLNAHQVKSLNSWVAYRDHSLFSFKIATVKIDKLPLKTADGGSILENHDFYRLDLEKDLHSEAADFGQLAKKLIARRLSLAGISTDPDEFFPSSQSMLEGLEAAGDQARAEAKKLFPADSGRQQADYVYRMKRAFYFRSRSVRANRPQYSGFDTLVFISTGVIRNLLEPCYWMFDKALSEGLDLSNGRAVIPPEIQASIIQQRSERLWERLRDGLDSEVQDCSSETAKRAYNLLDQLAILFRNRLLSHNSEPSANSFTISGEPGDDRDAFEAVLTALRRAQYLYVRSGPAKDSGRREPYYVPNRMLWPARALDPHGQNARVSLPWRTLWKAAMTGAPLKESEDHHQPVIDFS